MSDEISTKPMRPNDMCTASYYDDVLKLKELLTVPEVEDEPPLPEDFDPSEQPNPLDTEEGGAEAAEVDPEEEEERKERADQRAKNKAAIEHLVSTADVLTTRLSPVNVSKYGLHLYVEEANYNVTSRFKTSRKSTIAATPLHWAVLGRAHKAVAFLVANGADVEAQCPVLKVTPIDICKANGSLETLRLLEEAKAAYVAGVEAKADAEALRVKTIADREEAVREHYRREAEEERLAAEREAAEEEAEYGHGDEGEGYDEGEGEEYYE